MLLIHNPKNLSLVLTILRICYTVIFVVAKPVGKVASCNKKKGCLAVLKKGIVEHAIAPKYNS